MRWVKRCLRDGGQMTVEMAVLVPVAIVVALVVLNLMEFVDACAAFDRLSLDAVVSQGVAPSGEQSSATAVEAVKEAIASGLGRESTCEVEVRAEQVSGGGEMTSFVISPLLTRYVCTLSFRPWPSLVRMPGITFNAPVSLRHERSLVVDRYRPGVVV